MKQDSHVVLCGAISKYNETQEYPPPLSDEMKSLVLDKNITRYQPYVNLYLIKVSFKRVKLAN